METEFSRSYQTKSEGSLPAILHSRTSYSLASFPLSFSCVASLPSFFLLQLVTEQVLGGLLTGRAGDYSHQRKGQGSVQEHAD